MLDALHIVSHAADAPARALAQPVIADMLAEDIGGVDRHRAVEIDRDRRKIAAPFQPVEMVDKDRVDPTLPDVDQHAFVVGTTLVQERRRIVVDILVKDVPASVRGQFSAVLELALDA